MTIFFAADYILFKTLEGGERLSQLKLQKLLYYAQAWHLALFGLPLFPSRFQAWVHGPINADLFNRFAPKKSLYSLIECDDLSPEFNPLEVPEEIRRHLDDVLEVYAGYTGSQLEDMSRREDPWIQARQGFAPSARCQVEIDEEVMRQFYVSQT